MKDDDESKTIRLTIVHGSMCIVVLSLNGYFGYWDVLSLKSDCLVV